MPPLFDMMLEVVPGPEVDPDAPLQMLVTNLDWSDYVGRIAIGRIYSGTIRPGQQIALMQADDESIARQESPRSTSSTSSAAPRSKKPRPATSPPWSASKTSRSATRSAIRKTAARCRA